MKLLKTIASALLSLIVPVFVIIISIRVLLTPVFYQIEYRMPYFPPDPYGFSQEDRLKGAALSIDYLLNDATLDYFNQFKLGDGTPFYNLRELSHMLDVKILIKDAFSVWFMLLAILIMVGAGAKARNGMSTFWKALSRGGLLTIILIVLVLFFVILAFSSLFTQFHMLFFTGDTWLFEYSDTLIRLFPMQFWQDAFIWIAVLSIAQSLAIFLLGKKWAKKAN